MITPDGSESTVELKGCDLVILESISLCFHMHAVDIIWFPKNGDKGIDEVAGQFKQPTAWILGKLFA